MTRKKDLGYTPSPYQEKIFDFVQHGHGNAVISALAGSGKCLAYGTEVLMYDGSIQKVENIVVGDKVMGDDSTPRTVLSTTHGYQGQRMIITDKSDCWLCNDVHILTVTKEPLSVNPNAELFDIPINEIENNPEYIKGEDGYYKNLFLVRTAVDFHEHPTDNDPFYIGSVFAPIHKFIPKKWLTSTIEDRGQILRGLFERYGMWKVETNIESKSILIRNKVMLRFDSGIDMLSLFNEIKYLLNSLGMTYNYEMPSSKKKNGAIIDFDMSYGELSPYFDGKGPKRTSIKFRVQKTNDSDYYGFTLDGNGRFLLGDFVITHNTTTLVSCMKLIPSSQKCLFLAFNKSIVDTLSERVKGHPNCFVKTMHSLGYLMIRRNLGSNISIDEYKYRTYVKANISKLTSVVGIPMTKAQVNAYIESIISLINFARYNMAQNEKEIEALALKYDIPINYDEPSVVRKALKWGREHTQTIDYTDMVWLPTELSLKPMGLQYDWVLSDECQDFSIAYIQLMKKCFKKGTRFICVGDEKQSINQFAGASEDAFQSLCNYPNTTVFELPITYRCPTSVVDLAKHYVNNIMARDGAPNGFILNDVHVKDLKSGDMVLSRTKAPLLSLYTRLLRDNVECYIKGTDMGPSLIKMIERIDKTRLSRDLRKDGIFVRLYDELFTERNKLMKRFGLSKKDATLSSKIMEMYDSISSLMILSENLNTKRELINHINEIFNGDNRGIMLSTIHKAKGLEANNVYILCRSAMPSKLAKSKWQLQQEENLIYVAITRTKNILGYVSEKDVPPSGSNQDPNIILRELRQTERTVCRILNKVPMKEDDNIELTKLRAANAEDIDMKEIEAKRANVADMDKKEDDEQNMMDLLSKYLSNGGDINALKKFISNA